jgi:hypothetical protein
VHVQTKDNKPRQNKQFLRRKVKSSKSGKSDGSHASAADEDRRSAAVSPATSSRHLQGAANLHEGCIQNAHRKAAKQ